tara:strand:+ start:293 stop:436 length:144 start_codon:yes stop_codon:yes gene_type:complete
MSLLASTFLSDCHSYDIPIFLEKIRVLGILVKEKGKKEDYNALDVYN